jgi:acyl carrier protein
MSDARDTLKQELRSLILEIAEKDEISDDTHFKDVGIDSMMGVEIVAAIERQYKSKSKTPSFKKCRRSTRATTS